MNKKQKNNIFGDDPAGGFTLIEVLIAMTVFSVGILAVITMQTTSVSGNAKANYISEAANIAADQMEILLNSDYSTIKDDPSVGTNSGINGLDDGYTANTTADYTTTSSDGLYNIYWNVINNAPVSSSKTLKVFVVNNILNNPVTITFVKADGI